jgi:hypothetical protein
MVGLVIDAGMCMTAHRQAQNAADAGALAAMMDVLNGKSTGAATTTAISFVTQYNQDYAPQQTLSPAVNFPPTSGSYAGRAGYVECDVTVQVHTFLLRLLPGANSMQQVSARAVAGIELGTVGVGTGVLDQTARPGIDVSGGGRLRVNGTVVVNSDGGGVTETGAPINNGSSGFAVKVGNNGTVVATEVDTVGGVNDPSGFQNYTPGGPNPLHTGQLPVPDPLAYLPTPTTANGVDPTSRGSPSATNGSLKLNDPSGFNKIITDPVTHVQTMQLYPGIYDSISITGGNVQLYPGIYVLAAQKNNQATLSITGGNVTANGVMFYNTGSNYNPATGAPDINDKNSAPPITDGALLGSISMNGVVPMSPIDTNVSSYNYGGYQAGAPVPSSEFNGMLFYQRRNSTQTITVSGNAGTGSLNGTLYAKYAQANFTGQGSLDAQFIVGSIKITGQGTVTINFTGTEFGQSKLVYLVE